MDEIAHLVAIRSIIILANPRAGSFSRRKVEGIASILRRHGLQVEICYTKQSGEISRIVEERCAEVDAIAIHGGDGSINEAIAGLHRRRGRRPVLIVIPGGTADVLANELDLPVAATRIAQSIINGKTLPLHYGLANGRPFFLMASAGFDAAVVYAISPGLKQVMGKFAFVVAAVRLVFREKLPDVLVEAEGQTIRCRLAIVTNSACYGGGYLISPDNSVIRPGLRLIALTDDNFLALLRAGWRVITGRVEDGAEFFVRSITTVRLAGDRPVLVQIDGEAFGTTPVELEPVAEALRIVVAQGSAAKRLAGRSQ
ncbi:MAG: diacylglycerol/lipid kinase family protein [Methylocella sp.]